MPEETPAPSRAPNDRQASNWPVPLRPAVAWLHARRPLLHNLGAAAGLVALVGVIALALTREVPAPAPPPHDPWSGPWALPAPTPTTPTTPTLEKVPEVWTRLAGLNVWIAGRREQRGGGQSSVVVMLHGYGKPRENLLTLAEREALRFGTLFLFPEAPVALDWRRRAWWRPRPANGKVQKTLPPGRIAARKQVRALLEEVRERFGVSTGEIVLAGFSQGGTLAFEVALHTDEPLGGLAILSGRLNGQKEWHPLIERLRGIPVLMTHGRRDPVAPFSAADKLRRALQGAGVLVEWVPYDQGHVVTRTTQRRFASFIARTIAPDDDSARIAGADAGKAKTPVPFRGPPPPPAAAVQAEPPNSAAHD